MRGGYPAGSRQDRAALGLGLEWRWRGGGGGGRQQASVGGGGDNNAGGTDLERMVVLVRSSGRLCTSGRQLRVAAEAVVGAGVENIKVGS